MPYDKLTDLPEAVQALPKHGQEIFLAAFNAAFDEYKGDEDKTFATAWAAVGKKYEKDAGGAWHMKKTDERQG